MRTLCIKLAILNHTACRNYKAKRHPLVIYLFYNYSRFYNIVFLKNKRNYYNTRHLQEIPMLRVSQGFWGTREHWQNIKGNKGTLANFWEQGTKFRKITVRKHSERVWEHGNIGQFWKGTREQGPPLGDPLCSYLEISTEIEKII